MIEEIVSLKAKGYSLRKIAFELDTTVGKVHYRLKKYTESLRNESLDHDRKPSQDWEFPTRYEHTRITAMPQNPYCIYLYWDVDTPMQNLVAHQLTTDWECMRKQLRIYDVSDMIFNGHDAHRYFDIILPEMTGNWFIRNLLPNRTYVIDYGVLTRMGTHFTIVRSNPVETPRDEKGGYGRHEQPVQNWKNRRTSHPAWFEHFSTYSYYK